MSCSTSLRISTIRMSSRSSVLPGPLADDDPLERLALVLDHGRRRHPVLRLEAARVGVDEKRAVRLEHQQPHRLGQDGVQASRSRRPRSGRRSGARRHRTVRRTCAAGGRRVGQPRSTREPPTIASRPSPKPDERLAVAVVVGRPDDELGLVAVDAHRLAERGRRAAPVGDERVALPLTPDRRLVGVTGQARASRPAASSGRP